MDQFLRPKGRYHPCPKQISSHDRNEIYEEVEVEHYLPSPYGPLTFKKVVTVKKEKRRPNNPVYDQHFMRPTEMFPNHGTTQQISMAMTRCNAMNGNSVPFNPVYAQHFMRPTEMFPNHQGTVQSPMTMTRCNAMNDNSLLFNPVYAQHFKRPTERFPNGPV